MHGRSLVRTLDAGVMVIVTAAIALLGLLSWAARSMDRTTFETESKIVQRHLGQLAAEFRAELPNAAVYSALWLGQRPQHRAILRKSAGQTVADVQDNGRIGGLLKQPTSAARLARVLDGLPRLDLRKQRTDFVLLGPQGDESLALISLLPGSDETNALAIGLVDYAAMTSALDPLSIHLLPVSVQEDVPTSANGQIHLTGFSDEVIAVLPWSGRRVSTMVSGFVMPVLAVILLIGLSVLMILRHHWSIARDGFLKELKSVETIAHTDALTGLPNRRALFDHLRKVAPSTMPYGSVTVMMLDLDGFKWVNDYIGHQAGDRVLAQAAAVFRDELGTGGFVARLGGDEFVAIIPGDVTGKALQNLHAHLAEVLRQRISAENGVQIGVSIGAAASGEFCGDGEDLLRLADLAVYSAKAAGRGVAMAYDPSMKQEKAYRRNTERELKAALLTGSIFLAHQPIVDALSGNVLGYESLARWQHPVRGVIAPGEFIPIAEQSDLIVSLGRYVLDHALAELGPKDGCRISVNATGRQLLSENFVTTVRELLARHKVEPQRLCLELTETSLITDRDRVAEVMADLQAHGVRFAIDDFGAGYSSLNYLLRFKFDVLKIDRDFILDLDDKPEAPMIVTSIVALARSLGMKVVGEGIETPAQHRFLASAGCTALQGFLFGKPMPIGQLDHARRDLVQRDLAENTKTSNLDQETQAA